MRRDPAKAIAVLDAMLEFFDGGRRWTRGKLKDGDGNRCLVGALQYARSASRVRADGTAELLYSLMPDRCRHFGHATPRSLFSLRALMGFNDTCMDYQEVRWLIVLAREIALAELLDGKEHRRPRSEPIHPDRSVTACYDSHAQEAEANKRRLLADIELEKGRTGGPPATSA